MKNVQNQIVWEHSFNSLLVHLKQIQQLINIIQCHKLLYFYFDDNKLNLWGGGLAQKKRGFRGLHFWVSSISQESVYVSNY